MGSNKGYNYIDKQFGRLKVIKDTGKRHEKKGKIWLCLCSCGELKEASTVHLRQGNVRSCGCLLKENRKNKKFSLHRGVKNYSTPDELKNMQYKFIENGFLQVFENGRVFKHNKQTGKIVECKQSNVIKNGKKVNKLISYKINGKIKKITLSRLLAEVFIPNLENKEFVSFRDCNNDNISLDNLFWTDKIGVQTNYREFKKQEKIKSNNLLNKILNSNDDIIKLLSKIDCTILKQMREKNNLSTNDLSNFLNIHISTYRQKEKNPALFNLIEILKLLNLFNVSIEELFLKDNKKEKAD